MGPGIAFIRIRLSIGCMPEDRQISCSRHHFHDPGSAAGFSAAGKHIQG
jgi:hypothetical protein